MKKNLKKVVCALMASAMVLSMAGCGGSSDSASTSGGNSGSGGTSAASGDTIRFAVMSPMTGENAATGEQLANGVAIAVDEINALGSTIYGATLEILSVTPDLSNLFSYFNYSLEVSENITPLWPPLYSVDGVLCSNKKKVYLLSSFTLVPHSNISCENDKLELFDDVFELDITLPVRISRNNVSLINRKRYSNYLPGLSLQRNDTRL